MLMKFSISTSKLSRKKKDMFEIRRELNLFEIGNELNLVMYIASDKRHVSSM